MSHPRMLLAVVCLLGLTCTAFAQNLTASTPPASLTLMSQDMNNFTNQALPAFPCDSITPGVVGGYSSLNFDDQNTDLSLTYVLGAVYNYYQYATTNLTGCTFNALDYGNVSTACSQVVAGTNYAVEVEVLYDCIGLDTELDSSTLATLRSTAFVPLSVASFKTEDQQENGPVVKDIWFASPPEVIAFPEGVPEEASPEEASPEEASPEEEAPAPESSNDNTTSTQLLTPTSGGGLGLGSASNSQLAFSSSPAASSSPSPSSSPANTSSSPEPEPEVVQGFDVAAQNRSVASG